MLVTISGWNKSYNPWTMTFDLRYICENIGKKQKDLDRKTYTVLTIPHTRKILKLIKQYADNGDEITAFLAGYPKVFEIWNKIK